MFFTFSIKKYSNKYFVAVNKVSKVIPWFFRDAAEETGINTRGADEDADSISERDRQVGENQQGTQETVATQGRK